MLLRAVFWIGVVSLLMPHEPNLGFGRPSAAWWPGAVLSWVDSTVGTPSEICKAGNACKTVLQGVNSGQDFAQNFTGRSIADARAEIQQAERERGGAE
jgi:hypothetical protein